jgi:uncharacterized protein (DUF1800 family)
MDDDTYAIRFGFGLPSVGRTDLSGPDRAVLDWPGIAFTDYAPVHAAYRQARKAENMSDARAARRDADALFLRGVKATIARALGAEDPFRERLVAFWADHFTTAARNRMEAPLPFILIDEAIRPHVAGRFADMLRAVMTHPAMLVYLNQEASFGPGSRKGLRQKKGLNENLARELLELHTLGVGAAYSQGDVRELAELLTGLTVGPEGFVFDKARVEPGTETVLGVTYGGEGMAPILSALDALALRPETASHIARKLCVHFVSDDPDPALVADLGAAFLGSDGDLAAVYAAFLAHPAAGGADPGKARQPFDYLIAALRALGVGPADVEALRPQEVKRLFLDPMEAMGQPLHQAPGPDGWPEAQADWITPQGLAARIDWAMAAPERLVRPLPDPRSFLQKALGARAGEKLAWAVAAAESARDGVGLVVASPEFNRR